MNMINSKVRFAVCSETGRVFCYLTGRYHAATGFLESADGKWDLAKVKSLILADQNIQSALVAGPTPDKVEVANKDFEEVAGKESEPAPENPVPSGEIPRIPV